jgi:hypothetical protein
VEDGEDGNGDKHKHPACFLVGVLFPKMGI